jgi:hypothetical protein
MKGMPLAVRFPVVDLRREPIIMKRGKGSDPLQETQLLYNEHLYGFERYFEWIRVEAPMQPKCLDNSSWQGYPGWVQVHQVAAVKNHRTPNLIVNASWTSIHRHPDGASSIVEVCCGTRLNGTGQLKDGWQAIILADETIGYIPDNHIIPLESSQQEFSRIQLLEYGRQYIGSPYLWGGKSAHHPSWSDISTSFDCSGFVYLLYSLCGITIPRDAHDQYLKSKPCAPADLQPADLVFFASVDKPSRMNHVMLYMGDDRLLEATSQSGTVREISCEERCGKPLKACQQGERLGDLLLFAGAI